MNVLNKFQRPIWQSSGLIHITLLTLILCFIVFSLLFNLHCFDGVNDQHWCRVIFFEIRLPRLLLATIVGALLAVAGNAMQGVFQNPLASPDLLGSSSAATLASVMALYIGQASVITLLFSGVLGALFGFLLIFIIAYRYSSVTLILTGVAINALLGALIALVLSNAKNPWALSELYLWLQGSLALAQLNTLWLSALFFVPGLFLILSQRKLIDALTLGEQTAITLGINVKKSLFITILGVSLIIGATVPQTGVIGFIGLVAPHFARLLTKRPPSGLYLTSALFGSLLLLIADGLVWHFSLFNSVYVGTLTAFIGAPFLVLILIKQRRYHCS